VVLPRQSTYRRRAGGTADARTGEWSGDGGITLPQPPCFRISQSEGKEDGEGLAEQGERTSCGFLRRRHRLSPAPASAPDTRNMTQPPPLGV
jgi:hypothetical protein